MNQRSLMEYDFQRVENPYKQRSSLNHAHRHLTTFDANYLIPILCKSVNPGDTWYLTEKMMLRLASSLKFPIMDNIKYDTFYFYQRSRFLWDNFQFMMGERKTPTDSTSYLVPQVDFEESHCHTHDIYDYFGIPVNVTGLTINALPLRMYYQVFNDFFRHELLDDPLTEKTDDGHDDITDYELQIRRKRRDYFTSCNPYPIVLSTDITVGLLGTTPVFGNGKNLGLYGTATDTTQKIFGLGTSGGNLVADVGAANGNIGYSYSSGLQAANDKGVGIVRKSSLSPTEYDRTGLYADMSESTALSISSIRLAAALQQILERDARGGPRYTEQLFSRWGIRSSDAVQQRPEYLGGSSGFMNINPVANTANSANGVGAYSYPGDLAAFASAYSERGGFRRSFEEHGYILGLICVTSDNTYERGLERMWSQRDRWDFYHPELDGLSEMPVYNREIWCENDSADEQVFGYQPAWSFERFSFNRITGLFRSNPTTGGTLNYMHLAQVFSSRPYLNSTFLINQAPMDRIVSVTSQPDIIADIFFDLRADRVMSAFGTPGIGTL